MKTELSSKEKKSIEEDFIAYMKHMENRLAEDINNCMIIDKRYAYLLGRGKLYDGVCPCRKNRFELKPNNAIHIIISNNIYSVWFEALKVIKETCNIELIDDFMSFYRQIYTENTGIFGCFRPRKRVYSESLKLEIIVDYYILQFQLERENGFYIIKKPISIL